LYLDPHVESFEVDGLEITKIEDSCHELSDVDLVILLQPHRVILESGVLESVEHILDTSGSLTGPHVDRL